MKITLNELMTALSYAEAKQNENGSSRNYHECEEEIKLLKEAIENRYNHIIYKLKGIDE